MDEEDYMSDNFIASCLSGFGSGDVRPGLTKNRKEQREHELMKKKIAAAAEMKKSTKVCQAEALEEGLRQPIGSSNKGFSMLEKMGFKTGMGLGKNNSGIVEPISINIKNNKLGLGRKPPPSKMTISKKNVENKLDKLNEKDFTAFHSQKDRERKTLSDLKKSQRICRELDMKVDKMEPKELWFWPDEPANPDEEKEAGDCGSTEKDESETEPELSHTDKLEILTRYLRENYFYCIWCTVQYDDEKDMQECPGWTRDDH